MGEWLKPAVLKTVCGVTRTGVRIPLPPPDFLPGDAANSRTVPRRYQAIGPRSLVYPLDLAYSPSRNTGSPTGFQFRHVYHDDESSNHGIVDRSAGRHAGWNCFCRLLHAGIPKLPTPRSAVLPRSSRQPQIRWMYRVLPCSRVRHRECRSCRAVCHQAGGFSGCLRNTLTQYGTCSGHADSRKDSRIAGVGPLVQAYPRVSDLNSFFPSLFRFRRHPCAMVAI
jgi:hypothetical protein